MPVNKDAMARYRIIDRMLADPNKDYTTAQIARAVSRECPQVTLRMIQKDIKALEDDFGKEMVRNSAGRGTVRYEDQSAPLFYQELTSDEEEILREVLRSLGQFEGLDNFTWLDLLKKKLDISEDSRQQPIISFSKNEGLQMPETLLGRLFTAISRKKVIRFTYTVFGGRPKEYTVYPYQLKQFNDRWFLLCTPVEDDIYPYSPDFIATFALDRMDAKFEYEENIPYIETPVDLKDRFDEVIGVTILKDKELEYIYFAVHPQFLPYIQTKYLHWSQIQLDESLSEEFKQRYPSLKDWTFFTIECRPNNELYARFASYSDSIVLVEPVEMREEMARRMIGSAENYSKFVDKL
ncbi:MAG: WYL domain-containing protein [Bacteroidales bacterium]|nr:WYL domain-containing protein [Bacteroidales bacterium]